MPTDAAMDMATALAELGVTEDSPEPAVRDRLDRDGYAPLAGVLSDGQAAAMRTRLAGLLAAEGNQAGIEMHQEAGTDRLADLVNKDPVFGVCFTDPGCWRASPTCWAGSSSSRSTSAPPCP